MNLDKALLLTNLFYVIFILYIVRYSQKNRIGILGSIILIFMITPYNILINRVGNTNEIQLFNSVYRLKILGLSIADFIMLGFGCYLVIFKRSQLKKAISSMKIMKIIFIRDILYICLGSVSFFLTRGYFLDGGRTYLITIRSFLFCWITYFIVRSIEMKKKKINFLKIFQFLIIGSFILSFFFRREDVWIRFGNKIMLLSQEWGLYYSIYLLIYFVLKLINKVTIKKLLISIFLIYILLNDFYKTNIVQILYFIIFLTLFCNKNRIIKYIKNIIYVISVVVILVISIINLKETQAIETRFQQWNEYTSYISKSDEKIYRVLFGSGIGSPYEGKMGDFGESKSIDREKFGKYKFAIQTPYISNFKEVGIVGIIGLFIINGYLSFKLLVNNKRLKRENMIEYRFIIYVITYNLLTFSVFNTSPPLAIFFGVIYARYNKYNRI